MTWNWFEHYEERLADGRLAGRSALAQALYPALLAHADGDRLEAHPGHDRLAGLLRCSTRSVRRALAELVDAGLVVAEQAGAGRPCRYRFPGAVWASTAGQASSGRPADARDAGGHAEGGGA